jgi:hypothetical protein
MRMRSASEIVAATLEHAWAILKEKMLKPEGYVPDLVSCEHSHVNGEWHRRLTLQKFAVTEAITVDEAKHTFVLRLVEHPRMTGDAWISIVSTAAGTALIYTTEYKTRDGQPADNESALESAARLFKDQIEQRINLKK